MLNNVFRWLAEGSWVDGNLQSFFFNLFAIQVGILCLKCVYFRYMYMHMVYAADFYL